MGSLARAVVHKGVGRALGHNNSSLPLSPSLLYQELAVTPHKMLKSQSKPTCPGSLSKSSGEEKAVLEVEWWLDPHWYPLWAPQPRQKLLGRHLHHTQPQKSGDRRHPFCSSPASHFPVPSLPPSSRKPPRPGLAPL